MLTISLLLVVLPFSTTDAAFYYPDVQTSLLEHILVDNWGAYASNFSSAITPCTRYVTQTGTAALNSGRTTAAQWMRVLFHDFITANVSAGTGGIDASIGFETARAENSGSAFNDSFTFWKAYVNSAVSMADLVALGTAMSNNLCGGRNLPYRAGRIDATSAGLTAGVPAPETDLEETLVFFERAGFNKEDSIGLTACGHTMGSVHHGGFPDVVDETFVTPNNTNGGSNFDTTRGAFDPKVLSEYLDWTGNKGGPLVTSNNVTARSDLRLYESDQNATMRALFAQGDDFLDTCVSLMGRAMNTVPSGTELGHVIDAMPVKPINVTFNFDVNGAISLSGNIRVLTAAGTPPTKAITLSIAGQSNELLPETDVGSSVFGRTGSNYGVTTYFPFSVSGPLLKNTTSFVVSAAGISAETFEISHRLWIVPSLTSLSDVIVNVTIATSSSTSCSDLTAEVASPLKQGGTLAPTIKNMTLGLRQLPETISGYTICHGQLQLDRLPTGLVSINVEDIAGPTDRLLLNGGAAGW